MSPLQSIRTLHSQGVEARRRVGRSSARVESQLEPSVGGIQLDDAVARAPELADDEHYVAAKRLVKGVIAAGSYKKYLRLPLQELLNLLSLAQRGKLATTDPVMKSLIGVDNHVVWNVLTYWAES